MASIKILSLMVKTLAKPIANTIKQQATQHESFRNLCIGLAQRMHRTEARMRMGLLNEEAANVKPLNDAKAVQNGANTLAESFLFAVGAGLVLGETYRSSRKNAERRDNVAEELALLKSELAELKGKESNEIEELRAISDARYAGLERALSTIVARGLKVGWEGLGHNESQVLNLIGELPGQPFALREKDGSGKDVGGEEVRDVVEAGVEDSDGGSGNGMETS